MTIGSDAIGEAPIAASGEASIINTNTFQFAAVIGIAEIQPSRTFQFAAVIGIASIQPVRTSQFAIIIGALRTTRRITQYGYARPIRIAQATPLYTYIDAPTNEDDLP